MLSNRYHLITIVAVFFSLGTGILLGGTLGRPWLQEHQRSLVYRMEQRYDEARQANLQLEKKIESLEKQLNQQTRNHQETLERLSAGQLKGRRVLIWDRDTREGEALKQTIQKAGGMADVSDVFPDPNRYDVLVFLTEPDSAAAEDSPKIDEAYRTFSGPVILRYRDQPTEPVWSGTFTGRLIPFQGAISRDSLNMYRLVCLIRNVTKGKGEKTS
ncbi:copper transporter [Paludifilum halophilum]|uniref:copper transporter n=1 Tax=Paludifilum halophilum TaxID=1642702 RepID=UPI001469A8EC|nr:copper transporter [Paludifilum halophilum]